MLDSLGPSGEKETFNIRSPRNCTLFHFTRFSLRQNRSIPRGRLQRQVQEAVLVREGGLPVSLLLLRLAQRQLAGVLPSAGPSRLSFANNAFILMLSRPKHILGAFQELAHHSRVGRQHSQFGCGLELNQFAGYCLVFPAFCHRSVLLFYQSLHGWA